MGLSKIVRKTFQICKTLPFDTSTNGWPTTIKEAQTAIEYAKQNAEGFPRAGIRGAYNGTVGGGDWLGPNELLSNTPFMVFPVHTRINEITWGNQRSDVSFDIEFRKNSQTNSIFHTLSVRNSSGISGYEDGLSYDFVPGDTLWAQYKDFGTNCSDMEMTIWISRIVAP